MLLALLVGLLPGSLAGAVLFVAVFAMGYRWPGHPLRTVALLLVPSAVVGGVRLAFSGLDEAGLGGYGALDWVSLVLSLGFGAVLLFLVAACGSVIATGRAERRARGPEPWDRSRVVATVVMGAAAVLVLVVPVVLTLVD